MSSTLTGLLGRLERAGGLGVPRKGTHMWPSSNGAPGFTGNIAARTVAPQADANAQLKLCHTPSSTVMPGLGSEFWKG